ncbi:MAG: FAD-dependent oxidoreductase [Dongiaceae bacterium]
MQSHARVVVIGGGVTGCAILYHLAKAGWTDSILLERRELTSGSSWHAAGSLFALTTPSNAALLQKYTIELYPRLEAESGQSCGYHRTGGLILARRPDEVMALRLAHGRARRNGIETELLSPAEAKRLAPILDLAGVEAVMLEPLRGYCDPASVTQAFAKAARDLGATVQRFTPVLETTQLPSGEWRVTTPAGTITAEYVVNAAGLWAREVAALAGIVLPLMPVEHHYLVTEAIPEIAALGHELPNISEPGAGYYSRQEGKGLLFGAYEERCVHWAEEGTPLEFGHELLPDDLQRMEGVLARAVAALPCLATAGIKRVINGPMIFSPDLGPLLGPWPGRRNYICAAGVMTGFNQGGGIGRVIAEWIIEGEPGLDVSFWDVARFGDWAGRGYTKARTRYHYENRTRLTYPCQEYAAGRPIRTFPIHDRLAARGAVFGFSFGSEVPLWYARPGEAAEDRYGYGRGNWFAAVGEECRAVAEGVGLFEISGFAKYLVSGPGAAAWLDRLLANRVPAVGRTVLTPMLSPRGRLIGDFTLSRLDAGRFLLLGAGSMQRAHLRWFAQQAPADGSVEIENLSLRWCGLQIAGPQARTLLQRVALGDVGGNAFPFLAARPLEVGPCPEAVAVRVSFTGELGYELYCPAEYQRTLHEALREAGRDLGLRHAGMRALMALRLEKAFPSWGLELGPDTGPDEPGLGRFVRLDKGDFIGRAALLARRAGAPGPRLASFRVAAGDADCFGGEPIFRDGALAGYVTSGGYGHRIGASVALGYLKPPHLEATDGFEIEILGERRPAERALRPLLDPDGVRMRA